MLENDITRDKMTVLINDYKKVLDKTMILEPDIFLLEMPPSELPDYLDSLYDGILENYECSFLSCSNVCIKTGAEQLVLHIFHGNRPILTKVIQYLIIYSYSQIIICRILY